MVPCGNLRNPAIALTSMQSYINVAMVDFQSVCLL